jgi:MoaA/NifB/PqqE/SkfB family radical SAM enzyme
MGVFNLAFHVTDRCQLDCKHCLRDPGARPLDLDFDLFVRTLDQVAHLHKTSHVAMTGGEPTLWPRFLDAVDALADRGMTWHMVTNGRNFGWLMDRAAERPARRESMARVYFSLDGADQATHDAIRGAGSFRDVMTAATLARVHGVPFVVQMVVHARNQHQIEAFGLLASHLGAARASFAVLQPSGTPHDRDLFLPLAAWSEIADRIDRLAATLTMKVGVPEGWPQKHPFHVCEPFRSEQLHVDLSGRLNLCCQHAGIPQSSNPPSGESDVVADLRETPFAVAHGKLLGVIHRAQEAKLRQIADGRFGGWDHLPCNWCLKHFGKPHWGDGGAVGPEAERERWVGAWGESKGQTPRRVRLPIAS